MGLVWGGHSCPPPLTWIIRIHKIWDWTAELSLETQRSTSKAADKTVRPTRSRCRIDSQHLYQIGHFTQMVQGIAGRFIIPAKKIGIKHVLPRTAPARTRFDLGQADVAQRQNC